MSCSWCKEKRPTWFWAGAERIAWTVFPSWWPEGGYRKRLCYRHLDLVHRRFQRTRDWLLVGRLLPCCQNWKNRCATSVATVGSISVEADASRSGAVAAAAADQSSSEQRLGFYLAPSSGAWPSDCETFRRLRCLRPPLLAALDPPPAYEHRSLRRRCCSFRTRWDWRFVNRYPNRWNSNLLGPSVDCCCDGGRASDAADVEPPADDAPDLPGRSIPWPNPSATRSEPAADCFGSEVKGTAATKIGSSQLVQPPDWHRWTRPGRRPLLLFDWMTIPASRASPYRDPWPERHPVNESQS